MDVLIVGAGIAGLYTAYLLSKEGVRVKLIDRKKEIGKPIKCAGLVSKRIKKFFKLEEEMILNQVRKARFYCSSTFLELKSKSLALVLDREKLEKKICEEFLSLKGDLSLKESFIDFKIEENFLQVKTSKQIYKPKILIGADGANSLIRKKLGVFPKLILNALQAETKGNFDEYVELWFKSNLSKEFFGWVVPLNENFARVGIASSSNIFSAYKKFLVERLDGFKKPDAGGKIPIGLIKKSFGERILLVGDAACQVKPFSGGGITYSLIASTILKNAVLKALEVENFSEEFFKKNYEVEWKKFLAQPIKKGLMLRNFFNLPDFLKQCLFLGLEKFKLKKFIENWDFDLLDKNFDRFFRTNSF